MLYVLILVFSLRTLASLVVWIAEGVVEKTGGGRLTDGCWSRLGEGKIYCDTFGAVYWTSSLLGWIGGTECLIGLSVLDIKSIERNDT